VPIEASGDEQIFRLLLGELGESLSLPKLLEPDEDDSCHVLFDEKVAVEFRRASGSLVLFATLGEFDTSDRPDLALGLLEANLFWQGTAGATLGVSNAGLVVMAHRMPLAGLDLPKLSDVLERFVKVAEGWHRELRQPAVASDAPRALETASHELLRA
jgi:hypothetical protein